MLEHPSTPQTTTFAPTVAKRVRVLGTLIVSAPLKTHTPLCISRSDAAAADIPLMIISVQHLVLCKVGFIHFFLQEAYDNITTDVEKSRREGWHFAAKLVRGAYMHQERERAQEMGYEDPINPDYESTNRMYHR